MGNRFVAIIVGLLIIGFICLSCPKIDNQSKQTNIDTDEEVFVVDTTSISSDIDTLKLETTDF